MTDTVINGPTLEQLTQDHNRRLTCENNHTWCLTCCGIFCPECGPEFSGQAVSCEGPKGEA